MPNSIREHNDIDAILAFAVKTAKGVGGLLAERLGTELALEFKGAVDLVTEMDRAAEEYIVSAIKGSYPGHGILAEEGSEELSDTGFRWIIDPLDGTTNYAHGFPVFCVSIAFEAHGEVLAGVVYDPTRDELFTAMSGKGACLNGRKIKVSTIDSLDHSLLATGFPYDIRTSEEKNLENFSNFAVRVQAIRRAGSAALDLCYVACARFDGFWELKLHPWDIAAGTLIVKEAGGVVTDFYGAPKGLTNKKLLASNGLIHQEMSAVLTGGAC